MRQCFIITYHFPGFFHQVKTCRIHALGPDHARQIFLSFEEKKNAFVETVKKA